MKKLLITLILAIATILPASLLISGNALAVDIFSMSGVCSNGASASAVCKGDNSGDSAGQSPILLILDDAIRILSAVIGVASVFVIIVQGIRIVLSNGDSKTFENARNTIIYACIGIVIAILGQVIVVFILQKFGPSA